MKILLFRQFVKILLLFSITMVQCMKEPDGETIKSCLDKFHLAEEDYRAFVKGTTDPKDSQLENIKCFTYCTLERLNLLNEKGKVDIAKINDADNEKDMIQNCIDKHDSENEQCEYGFHVTTCIIKGLKDLGIIKNDNL